MIKNLIFKSEENEIKVLFRNETTEDPFSYVELIKHLLQGKELSETEFDDNITDEEKKSVNSMVDKINREVLDVITADN